MNTLMIILDPIGPSGYPMVGDWLRRTFKVDDCHVLGNVWACRSTRTAREIRDMIVNEKIVESSTKFIVVSTPIPWAAHQCASTDDCFG